MQELLSETTQAKCRICGKINDFIAAIFSLSVSFLGSHAFIINLIVSKLSLKFSEAISARSLANQVPSVLKGVCVHLIPHLSF